MALSGVLTTQPALTATLLALPVLSGRLIITEENGVEAITTHVGVSRILAVDELVLHNEFGGTTNVTDGQPVTIEVVNRDGQVLTGGVAAFTQGRWWVKVNAPSVPGHYLVRAEADVEGDSWKSIATWRVDPF